VRGLPDEQATKGTGGLGCDLTSAVEWTPGVRSVCICCGVGPAPLTASVGHETGTMSSSIAKGVVRAAAVLALTASIGAMVMLLGAVIRVRSSPDWYPSAAWALCCLAVIPGIVLWESIAAWRLRPKSIESIASLFVLAGCSGLGWSIGEVVCKVPAPFPKPVASGAVSLVLTVIGYIVDRIRVRFASSSCPTSGLSQ
jgi:hypothetical protein